jgi:cephalosporin hydroxylase
VNTTDDRAEFEKNTRDNALRMATDRELQTLALDATASSDRYGYSYLWSWLGLPMIQVPEDMVTMQEIIWETRPQVVIETGFARGGSAVFFSSLLDLLGEGLVVSIDIDVRAHNRQAVVDHPCGKRIAFVEGSSILPATLDSVRSLVPVGARVMVVLDSDHTRDHVLEELRLYGPLVTEGQFLVVHDTVIEEVPPTAGSQPNLGPGNSPRAALGAYLRETDRFWPDEWFNSKILLTNSRGGYLRCVKP